jgi:hypothetical protein
MKPRRRGLLISAFICVYLRFRIAGTTILAGKSARNIDTIFAGGGIICAGWLSGVMARAGDFYKLVFICVWRRIGITLKLFYLYIQLQFQILRMHN